MLYSAETIRKMIGTAPTIVGRPTQGGLWTLKTHLINTLHKIHHPDHGNEGFAPYLHMASEQALVSTTPWVDLAEAGDYFEPPIQALTDRHIAIAQAKWTAQ